MLYAVSAFSNTGSIATMKGPFSTIVENQKLSSPVVLNAARIPEIEEWKILRNGAATGVVRFHPVIEDGDDITTSPLVDSDDVTENTIVSTKSGSKYKLGSASSAMKKVLEKKRKLKAKKQQEQEKKQQQQQQNKPSSNPSPVAKAKDLSNAIRKSMEYRDLGLSGKTVGNGQYLLAGKAQRSTSGKSQIWTAYRANEAGDPIVIKGKSNLIKVKITTSIDAIKRENKNYQRATGLLNNGKFVKKLDFFEDAGEGFENQSALVLEGGIIDLKGLLINRRGRGFSGKFMRDAAAAAGQCVQAMHRAKLVWTDLKTENFVLTGNDTNLSGENGLTGVKGIDLESARPFGSTPVDYSPEACPPEFASAFVKGEGGDFVLDPSYDMWSLGMLMYELSTGRAYFENKSPVTITKTLSNPEFRVDVSKVRDAKLRELIESCLEIDPKKRPSIVQFLLHPFFTTTGIGPFSF